MQSSLPDKLRKLKNGLKLKTFVEASEEKGDAVEVSEVEKDGRNIATFVKKDGNLIESSATSAAQSSGIYEDVAKKVGAGKVILTTPSETAATAAVDESKEDDIKESEDMKLNQKTKEVKPKDPKTGKKVDSSLSKLAKLKTGEKDKAGDRDLEKEIGKKEDLKKAYDPKKNPIVLDPKVVGGNFLIRRLVDSIAKDEKEEKKNPGAEPKEYENNVVKLKKADGPKISLLKKLSGKQKPLETKTPLQAQYSEMREASDKVNTEKAKPILLRDMARYKKFTDTGRPFRVMAGTHPDHKNMVAAHHVLENPASIKEMGAELKKPTSELSRRVYDAIDSGHDTLMIHQPSQGEKKQVGHLKVMKSDENDMSKLEKADGPKMKMLKNPKGRKNGTKTIGGKTTPKQTKKDIGGYVRGMSALGRMLDQIRASREIPVTAKDHYNIANKAMHDAKALISPEDKNRFMQSPFSMGSIVIPGKENDHRQLKDQYNHHMDEWTKIKDAELANPQRASVDAINKKVTDPIPNPSSKPQSHRDIKIREALDAQSAKAPVRSKKEPSTETPKTTTDKPKPSYLRVIKSLQKSILGKLLGKEKLAKQGSSMGLAAASIKNAFGAPPPSTPPPATPPPPSTPPPSTGSLGSNITAGLSRRFGKSDEMGDPAAEQLEKAKDPKFESCVMQVKEKQGESKVNPWAVCHASLKKMKKCMSRSK